MLPRESSGRNAARPVDKGRRRCPLTWGVWSRSAQCGLRAGPARGSASAWPLRWEPSVRAAAGTPGAGPPIAPARHVPQEGRWPSSPRASGAGEERGGRWAFAQCQVQRGWLSEIQGACNSTIRRVAVFISLMVRRSRYQRNRSRSRLVKETNSSARCARSSVVLGWFMADPFRSGGTGPVAGGDPRSAAGLAAASPAIGGAGLPPGSNGSRNRAGNSCSPVRDGTLNPAVRCARRSGLADRACSNRMSRCGWWRRGGWRGRGCVPGSVTGRS